MLAAGYQGDPSGDGWTAQECTAADPAPEPVAVAVTAVPVVVDSTAADYFVLYAKHGAAGEEVEIPVGVARGEAGTTTLSENVAALPADRYRVEKYQVASPADIDGDCMNDITELDGLGAMSPVSPTGAMDPVHGAAAIADAAGLRALNPLATLTKFILSDRLTARPRVYFMNTGHLPPRTTPTPPTDRPAGTPKTEETSLPTARPFRRHRAGSRSRHRTRHRHRRLRSSIRWWRWSPRCGCDRRRR